VPNTCEGFAGDVTTPTRQTVTVYLPADAVVKEGSQIRLRTSLTFTFATEDGTRWVHVITGTPSIPLMVPTSLVALEPVVLGPNSVSLCADTVTYDASRTAASAGAGGRPLSYRWSLRKTSDPEFIDLLAFLHESARKDAIFSLPTSLLEDDVSYVLTLSATNFVGTTAIAKVALKTRMDAAPQVVTVMQAPSVVSVKRPLQLTATVRHSCPAQRAQLWFMWEFNTAFITGGTGTTNVDGDFITRAFPAARNTTIPETHQPYQAISEKALLAVPASRLRPGLTYRFTVHAGYVSAPAMQDAMVVDVPVPRAALEAHALVPSAIAIHDTMILDARASVDPDGTASLSYEWSFSGTSCFGLKIAHSRSPVHFWRGKGNEAGRAHVLLRKKPKQHAAAIL